MQEVYCTIYRGKGIRNDVHGKLSEIKHELQRQKQFPHFSATTLKNIIRQVIGTRDYRTERKYVLLVSKPSKEIVNGVGTIIWDVTGFCKSINNS